MIWKEKGKCVMRFGIMEMQLDQLIPSDISSGDAVDQMLEFNRGQLVGSLVQQGFPLIELGGDLSLFFPGAYQPKNIQRLLDLKHEKGISYTIHLPLWSVEPSTPSEPIRLGSVDAILDIIDAVAPLNPEVYVLHATGALAAEFYRMNLPETVKSLVLKQFQGNAISSIQIILEETGLPSRQLAIETIEFPLELTLEIADLLDLSICLDTGHVLAGFSGSHVLADVLNTCLPRLAEIHLHDSTNYQETGQLGYRQDHQTLGTQSLDVKYLMSFLNQHDFQGPIIFELTIIQAQASLVYLNKIGVIK